MVVNKKEKEATYRCRQCKGSGLIPAKVILCKSCEGKKCIACKESGYKQMPWIECNMCYGAGEINESEADRRKISGTFNEYMNAKHLTTK